MPERITNQTNGRINQVFPHKVCINLDRRPDRWQQMRVKFCHHGIHSVRRFPALDGDHLSIPANWTHTPGAYGCLLSHLQVVSEARQLGMSNVLIFEDDAVFDDHFQEKFTTYIKQLPVDWDMLFFGALHKDEPIKVEDNIARITRANSTYAYALRDTVFDDFIELNRKAETVLDITSFVLQQRFNCYCFTPHLAWVEADYSDAQNRVERHWYLQESLVLFGNQVDLLLSETTVVFAHTDHSGVGRATENLMYLVRYYCAYFSPHIAIVIVEQGAEPTIDPATLPTNCTYVFLRDEGAFNIERCFSAGISNADSRRKFFILSDSDIYLETLDIRANLRMCEQYDYATGFSSIVDLNSEDSLRLRSADTTRGIDITKTASRKNDNGSRGYCCFLNRDAIRVLLGGYEGSLDNVGSILSLRGDPQFRVFQSPNYALRLAKE